MTASRAGRRVLYVLLLMGISDVMGYCELPVNWFGEQQYESWFVRYSGSAEYQKYFYRDRETIKEGITVIEPSATFRCTTALTIASGITFFTYEHFNIDNSYCNSGVIGLARRALLYQQKQLPAGSGTIGSQCAAELTDVPNYNVLIKGPLSRLVNEGGSCPFLFTGKLHLQYDGGSGTQCSHNIDSSAHLEGGRLVLNGCSVSGVSNDLPVHDTFICVDWWNNDVAETELNGNVLMLAKETSVGYFTFHCVIYRSHDKDIEMSISPANLQSDGSPSCPKDVPYTKAGDGFTYVTLQDYEFCARSGEYVRDDGERSHCFYKECLGVNDDRRVGCPPGYAVPDDFTKSTTNPCTEPSSMCSRCSFAPDLEGNGNGWLSGLKSGKSLVTTYSSNFIKTFPLSDPSAFEEYSCVDSETKDLINTYYLRFKFLDAVDITCVHDKIFSSNDQKYVIHRETIANSSDNAAVCKVLTIPKVDLYHIYMMRPLSQDALCPFPAGTFQVTYSYDYDNENRCFSDRNSRAVVSTNTLSLSTCADYDTYDFPLKSTFQCIGHFTANALEDDESNGNIVLLRRTDNSEITYCARYKVSASATEISINVNTLDKVECSKGVDYKTFGNANQRRYRYFKLTRLPETSSLVPPTSTINFTPKKSTIVVGTTTTKVPPSLPPSRVVTGSTTLRSSTIRSSSVRPSTTTLKPPLSSVVPDASTLKPVVSSVKVPSTILTNQPTVSTLKISPTTSTTTTITTTTPTTTTSATTTTQEANPVVSSPDAYHVQVKFDKGYASHVDDQSPKSYANSLVPQIATRGGVSPARIPVTKVRNHRAEDEEEGTILLDFDVNPNDESRRRRRAAVENSAQGAANAYLEQINTEGDFQLTDNRARVLTAIQYTGYAWQDHDPCPNVTCLPDGKCVIYQGDYFCVCNVGYEGNLCQMALASGGVIGDLRIYIAIGAILAILVVVVIVGVVCCRHACCSKERKYEDSASTQELDADDEASLFNKRATAYHNTAFSTNSESGTLRSMTGLGKGHGPGQGQEEKLQEVSSIKYG